ncbi:MAG: hypothetical protein ACXAE3_15910 [Candidatus Kariarchaeaceae archaeon]|jgi:hypothetical protein
MDREEFTQQLQRMQDSYGFNFRIILYSEKEFCLIRIENLVVEGTTVDFSPLIDTNELIDLNLDFESCHFIDAKLILPEAINQVEFIHSSFRLGSRLFIHGQEYTGGVSQTSPIISLNKSELESLSVFDEVDAEFILQCADSDILRIHDRALPKQVIILSINHCVIREVGNLVTNEKLQLLSLEFSEPPMDFLDIHFMSPQIRKVRVTTPDTDVSFNLRIYTQTPNFYFLDLSGFQLSINPAYSSQIAELFNQLQYLKLPEDTEMDEKTKTLFRLLGISVFKNNMLT